MYSYHQFLFPFRFDYLKGPIKDRHEFYKNVQFDDRVTKHLEKLFRNLEKSGWEYKPFKFDEPNLYNDFVYFHDFVKDTLFNLDPTPSHLATSTFFEKKLGNKEIKFVYQVKNKHAKNKEDNYEEKAYILVLDSITLRIFQNGIGILSFEIENNRYNSLDDVIKINEFLRHFYPPFVGKNFSLNEVFEKCMPLRIEIGKDGDDNFYISENLNDTFSNLRGTNQLKIANYLIEVLGDGFTQDINEKNKFLIQPVIDDRMFVVCWYGNDYLADTLSNKTIKCTNIKYISQKVKCKEKKIKLQKAIDDWYRFVFIDLDSPSIACEDMKKEILKKSTYERWRKFGTLYGISRYSFVNLTSSQEKMKEIGAYYVIENMKNVYYQMIVLVLAVRSSILRFSDEITAISDLEPNEMLFERVSNLYQNYLRFVNKLYFKEVTPQDQGIELYDKMCEILNIQRDVWDLNSEIANLNAYVHMKQEYNENKEVATLTKIATWLVPPTLAAGILGMNIVNVSDKGMTWDLKGVFWFIGLIGIAYLIMLLILRFKEKK